MGSDGDILKIGYPKFQELTFSKMAKNALKLSTTGLEKMLKYNIILHSASILFQREGLFFPLLC